MAPHPSDPIKNAGKPEKSPTSHATGCFSKLTVQFLQILTPTVVSTRACTQQSSAVGRSQQITWRPVEYATSRAPGSLHTAHQSCGIPESPPRRGPLRHEDNDTPRSRQRGGSTSHPLDKRQSRLCGTISSLVAVTPIQWQRWDCSACSPHPCHCVGGCAAGVGRCGSARSSSTALLPTHSTATIVLDSVVQPTRIPIMFIQTRCQIWAGLAVSLGPRAQGEQQHVAVACHDMSLLGSSTAAARSLQKEAL